MTVNGYRSKEGHRKKPSLVAKMDQALEERVKSCKTCQEQRKMPATAASHPWEWPSRPGTRIHIDYAVQFIVKMFLIIIDAHSKWLDALCEHCNNRDFRCKA